MHNIESGIHPHHSEDREKSAKNEDENDYIPYKVWSKSSENNGNSVSYININFTRPLTIIQILRFLLYFHDSTGTKEKLNLLLI